MVLIEGHRALHTWAMTRRERTLPQRWANLLGPTRDLVINVLIDLQQDLRLRFSHLNDAAVASVLMLNDFSHSQSPIVNETAPESVTRGLTDTRRVNGPALGANCRRFGDQFAGSGGPLSTRYSRSRSRRKAVIWRPPYSGISTTESHCTFAGVGLTHAPAFSRCGLLIDSLVFALPEANGHAISSYSSARTMGRGRHVSKLPSLSQSSAVATAKFLRIAYFL